MILLAHKNLSEIGRIGLKIVKQYNLVHRKRTKSLRLYKFSPFLNYIKQKNTKKLGLRDEKSHLLVPIVLSM